MERSSFRSRLNDIVYQSGPPNFRRETSHNSTRRMGNASCTNSTECLLVEHPNGTASISQPNRSNFQRTSTNAYNVPTENVIGNTSARTNSTANIPNAPSTQFEMTEAQIPNAYTGSNAGNGRFALNSLEFASQSPQMQPEPSSSAWYTNVPWWGWVLLGVLVVGLIFWSWSLTKLSDSSSKTEAFQEDETEPKSKQYTFIPNREPVAIPYDSLWDAWRPDS